MTSEGLRHFSPFRGFVLINYCERFSIPLDAAALAIAKIAVVNNGT
jgi:hypothetical protein